MFFCHIKIAKSWCFYDDTIKVLSFFLWQCTQSYFLCSVPIGEQIGTAVGTSSCDIGLETA